jgi:hypothetical protein
MTKHIRKFLAKIRQRQFTAYIEREIYHKIFPHLRQRADHGYPFSSDDEMVKLHIRGFLDASVTIHAINRAAGKMPRAEGDAFRFIVARDFNERMEMYLKFAQEREYLADCDPRFVATAA